MRRQLKSMKPSPLDRQRGITLIESLIAILIAAVGILGILGVQMRTLTDTQTTVRRAQAVRLIEDLGERMKVQPNALVNLNAYVIGWEADTTRPPHGQSRPAPCALPPSATPLSWPPTIYASGSAWSKSAYLWLTPMSSSPQVTAPASTIVASLA